MNFTWDKRKNKANIKKHGVSFEQAVLVFKDEMLWDQYDTRHSVNEDRHILIGNAAGRILYVAATETAPDTTRIISARPAKKWEKEDYYGNGNLYFGNRSRTH
ncbi:hypothetical protein FACS1894163_13110 [Spirochaetia bacterium]|nr:hypothetical protein FACS1894163_13110 [Spirochaetia bacterium]